MASEPPRHRELVRQHGDVWEKEHEVKILVRGLSFPSSPSPEDGKGHLTRLNYKLPLTQLPYSLKVRLAESCMCEVLLL